MKKYVMILAAVVMALAFTACNKNNKPSEKKATFEITVSDVTATEAHVKVVPSDTAVMYYWGVFPKAEYTYASDAEAAADCIAYLKENAEYYKMIYEYYYGVEVDIRWTEFLDKGVSEDDIESLDPETAFYAMAFAIDTVNEALVGDIFKVEFTTLAVQKINLTFTTQETDTALWILPSNKTATYAAIYAMNDSIAAWGYSSALEMFEGEIEYYEGAANFIYEFGGISGDIYLPFEYLVQGKTYSIVLQGHEGSVFNSDPVVLQYTYTGSHNAPAKIQKHTVMLKKAKKATKINVATSTNRAARKH